MSDTYEDGYADSYDAEETTAEAPVDAQDVATLIAQGIADLEVLKAQVAEAEKRTEEARASAEEAISDAKGRAQEVIASARADATEIIEKVRREQDAIVAEVRNEANVVVESTRTEQDNLVAEVVEQANAAKEAYAQRISALIETGWATTGSLASLGHQTPRHRGGRRKKQ